VLIVDNSGKVSTLISEAFEEHQIKIIDENLLPKWFIKYLTE
jgi:hypothetical protein